jgi:hypothetical protein
MEGIWPAELVDKSAELDKQDPLTGQASALPMVLLFAFGQRYFMAGVATQGRKGRTANRCYIPATRRAASSICAAPRTRTIAATVDVSFAGSVTVVASAI